MFLKTAFKNNLTKHISIVSVPKNQKKKKTILKFLKIEGKF